MKKRQTGARRTIVAALAAVAAAFAVHAAEVQPAQAEKAVAGWLHLGPRRLGEQFRSREAESVKTFRGKSGRAVYHAVNLKGGGFVVTSGDTRLAPVIAFSEKGSFKEGAGAFGALLEKTLAGPVEAFVASDREAASPGAAAKRVDAAEKSCEAEWAELVAESDGRLVRAANGKAEISDVCVEKLLATEWGQGGFSIGVWNVEKNDWDIEEYPAADYYTPKGYPCGCVAAGGGQIMKYWRYPVGPVASFSNTCTVDGSPVVMNSIDGAFDWDSMYLTWDGDAGEPVPSDTAREAVGKLVYNIAVAVGMEWGEWYGSSSPSDFVQALKDKFGYKSGNYVWYDLDAFDHDSGFTPDDFAARMRDFYFALYCSLDAKMPVLMSISGDAGGHGVVADGYGYIGAKRYTHLNFGWYGSDNAWYFLPDETMSVKDGYEHYWEVVGLGFNIHPTEEGDVISGRTKDGNNYPVSGATVELYDADGNLKKSVTSDKHGIYAFRVTEPGEYTIKASHTATDSTPSTTVSVAGLSRDGSFSEERTQPWAGWCGNEGGNILKFAAAIPADPDPDPDPDPAPDPDPGTDTGKYTITFDPNGGTVSSTTLSFAEGAVVGDALPIPVRTGYDFIGWKITTTEWVDENTVVNSDISCTAQWQPIRVTLHLEPNGGTVSVSIYEVSYGAPLTYLPDPYRQNYQFLGWYTAKEGGTQLKKTDVMSFTEDLTIYAHWRYGTGPVIDPDDPEEGDDTGDDTEGDTDDDDDKPGYDYLGVNDIKSPYNVSRAVTIYGAAYYGNDVVGIVELKLGKVNAKKQTAKISGAFTGLEGKMAGKRVTLKAKTATGVDGTRPVDVTFDVKGYAPMSVRIGGGKFAGTLGTYWHVQTAAVGGAWGGATATFSLKTGDLSVFPGSPVTSLLPSKEVATVSNGKFVLAKAASVKWTKPKAGTPFPAIYDEASGKGLVVDTSRGKTNRSGLKIAYTPKKGIFKASFKLYSIEGSGSARKLKKYTLNAIGFIVGGKGNGIATCKKPAVSWDVTIK